MIYLRALLFMCLLPAASLPGLAEDNIDPKNIDPKKVEAIRELMRITGAQANRQELTNTFTQQLISVLQANNTTLDAGAVELIRGEVDAVVAEQLEKGLLQGRMYRIYARYFTLEELEGLIAFNRSDIGRKANRVMPLLMRESMSAAQAWSVELGPELTKRVQSRLAEHGISVGR